jgi:hypothetical protein
MTGNVLIVSSFDESCKRHDDHYDFVVNGVVYCIWNYHDRLSCLLVLLWISGWRSLSKYVVLKGQVLMIVTLNNFPQGS